MHHLMNGVEDVLDDGIRFLGVDHGIRLAQFHPDNNFEIFKKTLIFLRM